MIYHVYKQKPRTRVTPIIGYLSVMPDGNAMIFNNDNHQMLDEMQKVELIHASSKGIMLKGFEPAGTDKQGNIKFNYQEWWCKYPEQETP